VCRLGIARASFTWSRVCTSGALPAQRPTSGPRHARKGISPLGQIHHPGWYFNLCAHPEAELSRPGHTGKYLAHKATGAEYETYWCRAVGLYSGYAAYKDRTGGRNIPIMVLMLKGWRSAGLPHTTTLHRTRCGPGIPSRA
jgi:hypothetical protein